MMRLMMKGSFNQNNPRLAPRNEKIGWDDNQRWRWATPRYYQDRRGPLLAPFPEQNTSHHIF